MRKTLFVLLLTAAISLSARAQTAPADNDDVQLWHETQITVPLIEEKTDAGKTFERLNFFLVGNLRAGRNMSDLVDERIGAGFDYKFNDHVSFSPSYLYVAAQPERGRKQFESRLRLAATVENKWTRFSLRDRNLFEFRFRNNASNSVRYRNRLTFQYPILKNKKELFAPYAANEIFYDFAENSVTRNEITFGVSRKLSANVSADLFYLLRVNRGSALKYVNVVGFNLKIKLDRLFRSREKTGTRAENSPPLFP